MDSDDDDRKAKDVLDAATQADLARWFGLPSFTQVEEEAAKAPAPTAGMDAEVAALVERRQKACAAVDPVLLSNIIARHDVNPEDVFVFDTTIEIHVDKKFGVVDDVLVERAGAIADPREVELPEALIDALKECTPQALLRDLHRAETDFEKQFEYVDALEDARIDASAEARTAMSTRHFMPKREEPAFYAARRVWQSVRSERRRPMGEILQELPGRRVSD
jgi:hypothetical protein